MDTSKDDTKYSEDGHTGVSVARGSRGIKRRDVFSARSDGVGSHDAEDSGECERGKEEDHEQWAKDNRNEKGRENKQASDNHALLMHHPG